MPIEYTLLKDKEVPIDYCPNCKAKFYPFMRGEVQRPKKKWIFFGKNRPYCALICEECKEIVGYEEP